MEELPKVENYMPAQEGVNEEPARDVAIDNKFGATALNATEQTMDVVQDNGGEESFSEERARNIESDINKNMELLEKGGELGVFVTELASAGVAIAEFKRAGKGELVWDAGHKLREVVDANFEKIVNVNLAEMHDFPQAEKRDVIDTLVYEYSDPWKLPRRAIEHDLCGKGREGLYRIDDPDWLLEGMINAGFNDIKDISFLAKDLKKLGVSDYMIVDVVKDGELSAEDFLDANDWDYGSGARLAEAGVDKRYIIEKVFNSGRYVKWHNENLDRAGVANEPVINDNKPFGKDLPPFKEESRVEVLEKSGFDITDIAQTFSPDAVAANLDEFLARGADAKELMEYMMSYKERMENEEEIHRLQRQAIHSGERISPELEDKIAELGRFMVVKDKKHDSFQMIVDKDGMEPLMAGDGMRCVVARMETFAKNGVTAKDIIEAADELTDLSPYTVAYDDLLPTMLECYESDYKNILKTVYEKCIETIELFMDHGFSDPGFFDSVFLEDFKKDFYPTVIAEMSESKRRERREDHELVMSYLKKLV